MKLPRTIYWLSLLLLIVGGRTLIDPSNRSAGETIQIYITLVAFEAYMWLLLVLARWQWRKSLKTDVLRSGLFAVGLQGLTFLAINELHMASPFAGVAAAVAAALLAGLKLLVARRWLEFRLSVPLAAFSGGWILLMMGSGIVFSYLPAGESVQQTAAYVLCWIAAGLAMAHGVLAAWRHAAIRTSEQAGERWWIAWMVSGSLGLMTVIQLYGSRWGFFVDFPLAFLTPVLATAAMSGVVLSQACGRGRRFAWNLLGMTALLLLAINSLHDTPPEAAWMDAADGFFVHPLYPAGVAASLLAIVAGIRLRAKLLLAMGIGVFVMAGLVRLLIFAAPMLWRGIETVLHWLDDLITRILEWRYAQGTFLLGGAFVTLGIGAWLQHRSAIRAANTPPRESEREEADESNETADSGQAEEPSTDSDT